MTDTPLKTLIATAAGCLLAGTLQAASLHPGPGPAASGINPAPATTVIAPGHAQAALPPLAGDDDVTAPLPLPPPPPTTPIVA